MKIRIKGNSIRYRLIQSEVTKLFATGHLEEYTEFAGKTFGYLVIVGDEEGLTANFNGNDIVLKISRKMIEELHHTDRVGFEDKTGPVSLLIEKDFVCLDNVDEDQSDNYPNPALKC
ncbi:hypothetical protein TH53_01715 [Pedobacter lusitanus]|uniref:Uncharacterized protein n=1 Tax=Pedobacter lusitanus TaxID=1503925 RepID=A0A0D0GRK1_9SPHI|nr:hypothetical protein [Pedobacter lusitanus]KIO78825.1 hypothetical protein TH53_01715 [Pedobacter lusitanus]